MKLKQLEGLLGGLTQFSDPKVQLSITSRLKRWEMRREIYTSFAAAGGGGGCRWSWSSTRRALTSRPGCFTR